MVHIRHLRLASSACTLLCRHHRRSRDPCRSAHWLWIGPDEADMNRDRHRRLDPGPRVDLHHLRHGVSTLGRRVFP